MRSLALHLSANDFDRADFSALRSIEPQLVLAFFSLAAVRHGTVIARLQQACIGTQLVGCSTGGEIDNLGMSQHGLVAMALRFASGRLRTASWALAVAADSRTAGHALAAQLADADLHSVILFAQGMDVDGSALIESLADGVGPQVAISGGLACEGQVLVGGAAVGLGAQATVPADAVVESAARAGSWTLHNTCIDDRRAVAIGFYGDGARVTTGMSGGAQAFGPVRTVTHAEGHVLHELDGEPALDIYRRYLGAYANDLPGTGLLFPFSLLDETLRDSGVIRTLVAIDEETNSLMLAGNLPQGSHVRLMRASTATLTHGAYAAAQAARPMHGPGDDAVAILVSCVDRKMVMGGRTDDEIDAVCDVLGRGVKLTGFYSNGEIGHPTGARRSLLNNQTMSITCLSE